MFKTITRLPILIWVAILIGFALPALASDIIEITPLTNKILVIHFKDGYIEYNKIGETSDKTQVFKWELNLTAASSPGSYLLFSKEDPAYNAAISPVLINRKTRWAEISNKCNWNGSACDNEYVNEHFIYLTLPTSMQQGKSYTIDMGKLANNMRKYTFVYDEYKLRSEAVHVNQLGFSPKAGLKYAYVGHWMGDGGPLNLDAYSGKAFHIVDLYTHASVYSGTMQLRKNLETGGPDLERAPNEEGPYNNFFGADLYECDFSSFNAPGEYVVSVEGIGCSYPFEIKNDVYREALYAVSHGLYTNRSGIALTQPYTRWTRPRTDNTEDGFTLHQSLWRPMDGEEGFDANVIAMDNGKTINLSGWYQDAGDWDTYPTHTKVAIDLLSAYELAPKNFSDGELNIPESGNGIPDIIDHAAWQVYFMKRSMDVSPTGGVMARNEFYGTLPEGVPSWQTPQNEYMFNEDPKSSFLFAGAAAQMAYNLDKAAQLTGNPTVDDSSAVLIKYAKRAYNWGVNNQRDSDFVKLRDEWMFAAAWLYKYTGDGAYQTKFEELNKVLYDNYPLEGLDYVLKSLSPAPPDLNYYDQQYAVFAYVTAPDYPNTNTSLKSMLKTATINWGDFRIVEPAQNNGPRVGYEKTLPTLTGSATTPKLIEAMYAYNLSKDKKYLDYMYSSADYYLGGNAMNMLWMTGLGDRPVPHIFKLDWFYNNHGINDEPPPGLIPYGPWRKEDNGNWNGPWSFGNMLRAKAYPAGDQWPLRELWAPNRIGPLTNEYTIHQQSSKAMLAYGFLCDEAGGFTPNKAPSLTFASPTDGAVFNEGDSITFKVDATDVDGKVMKVEYFQGKRKLGESSQAPFTFKWDSAYYGQFDIYAYGIDNKGARTLSVDAPKIQIKVNQHYFPPVVSFISPKNGDHFPEDSSIVFQVNASDTLGAVAKVEFYANGSKVGESTKAPFTYKLANLTNGIYKVYAVAFDNDGMKGETGEIQIHVGNTKAPYEGIIPHIPGVVEIENYDEGGEGISYHDSDQSNVFAADGYRPLEFVDIQKSYDLGALAYVLADVKAGEWLEYTVNVDSSTHYDIALQYTCGYDGKVLEFLIDDDSVATLNIPNAGWWPYVSTSVKNIPLTKGQHVLRIFTPTGDFTANFLKFTYSKPIIPKGPYNGVVAQIPGVIEAENYDLGGEGVSYHDSDDVNDSATDGYRPNEAVDIIKTYDLGATAYSVSSVAPGEWLEYTVNVNQTSAYDMAVRFTEGFAGKTVDFLLDGTNISHLEFPNRGWWPYSDTTLTGVQLTKGQHILRISTTTGVFTLNYLKFSIPVDTLAPSAPTNLVATEIQGTSLKLSWNASKDNVGVVGYNVYKDGEKLNLDLLKDTVFTVTHLLAGTSYQFTVTAQDSSKNVSDASEPLTVITAAGKFNLTSLCSNNPHKTRRWRVTSTFGVAKTFSWSVYGTKQKGTGSVLDTAYFETKTVSNSPNTTIVTFEGGIKVTKASSGEKCIDSTAPSAPTGLSASEITSKNFLLSWLPSTDNVAVSLYLIFQDGILTGSTTKNHFKVKGLDELTAYSMTVKAQDASGNLSPSSDSLIVKTIKKNKTNARSAFGDEESGTFSALAFPNPAQNQDIRINISGALISKGVDVKVYDVLGRMVYKTSIAPTNETTHEIVIRRSSLTKGLHLIRIQNGYNQKNLRLIVE